MDRLDRALSSEETSTPTPGFTAAVMAQVRREAAAPRPLAFPWRRVLAVSGLGVTVGAAVLTLTLSGVIPLDAQAAWAGRLLAAAGEGAVLSRLATVLLLTCLTASLPRWLEG